MKWGVVAALVLVAFSGCLSDDREASAKGISGEMNDAARDWKGGAFPVFYMGMESPRPYNVSMGDLGGDGFENEFPDDDFKFYELPADEVLGNGKATGWLSLHLARGASDALGLILAADGDRVAREKFPLGFELPDDMPKTSLKDLEIDSPRALGIARDVEGWPDITADAESFVAFMLFFEPGESPMWAVSSGSLYEDGTIEIGFALIDAKDGELYESHVEDAMVDMEDPDGFFFPMGPGVEATPMQAGGTLRSERSVLQPTDDGAFEIDDGHPKLHALLRIPDHFPLASARATLLAPDGMEHQLDFSGPVLGSGEPARIEIAAPVGGEWAVELRLTRGISETIELLWCAEGSMTGEYVEECMEFLAPPGAASVPSSGPTGLLPRVTPWPDLGSAPSVV